MELALTGEPIGAERAAAAGLVSRLTQPGGALAGAVELARAVAANGPLAVAASKRILAEAPGERGESRSSSEVRLWYHAPLEVLFRIDEGRSDVVILDVKWVGD